MIKKKPDTQVIKVPGNPSLSEIEIVQTNTVHRKTFVI